MAKSIDMTKVTFLLLLFVSTARAQSIFDVTKDGAKANGPDINAVILQCNKKMGIHKDLYFVNLQTNLLYNITFLVSGFNEYVEKSMCIC